MPSKVELRQIHLCRYSPKDRKRIMGVKTFYDGPTEWLFRDRNADYDKIACTCGKCYHKSKTKSSSEEKGHERKVRDGDDGWINGSSDHKHDGKHKRKVDRMHVKFARNEPHSRPLLPPAPPPPPPAPTPPTKPPAKEAAAPPAKSAPTAQEVPAAAAAAAGPASSAAKNGAPAFTAAEDEQIHEWKAANPGKAWAELDAEMKKPRGATKVRFAELMRKGGTTDQGSKPTAKGGAADKEIGEEGPEGKDKDGDHEKDTVKAELAAGWSDDEWGGQSGRLVNGRKTPPGLPAVHDWIRRGRGNRTGSDIDVGAPAARRAARRQLRRPPRDGPGEPAPAQLSKQQLALLHALDREHEDERWLRVASRFFDETGVDLSREAAWAAVTGGGD